jgi:hypothetical protein
MGTAAKEYGLETMLRVDPAGSVEDRYRRDRQAAAGGLLTADEISEQFRVPVTEVAMWYAAGRLHGVYLDGQPRRFRRAQVVALLERLAAERVRAARRNVPLTDYDRELLFHIAAGRVVHRHHEDVLLNDSGTVRAYLRDVASQLPPGLVELPPTGTYRLTVKGAACLPTAVATNA